MGKFTAIKTYSRFLSLWNEDKIDRNSLTFILDTGQLYTHGIFLNSVAYGTEANGAIDITIAGTSKSLSLSSHTHSNYLEKDKNIDIGTYKIVSGDKDLLYYNAGNTYLGNSTSPVYLVGTEGKIVKGNSTYTLLDTGNFSIAGKTSSGVILSNTVLFTYGDKTFQIDYVRRYNSTSNFDSLNSVTSAGTTTVNGYKYGFITLNEDGTTNPSWSLIRIDVANRKLEFRTSSNPSTWVSPITSIPTNTATVAGIVSAPGENNSGKVWKTDTSGTPAWRDEIPNTWRNIRINDEETDSLTTGTGTGALYIKEGSGIKVTWEGNKIVIKNDSLNVWNANAVGVAGYVAAPTKADNANMTWLTDADGNPAWRASNNHSHDYLPLSGGLITDTVIAMSSQGLPTYGGNIVPTYNTAIGKNGIAFGGIDSSSDGAAIYLLNRGSDLNSLVISIGDNYSNTGTDEIEFRYCNWDGNYYSIGVPHKTGTIALTSDLGAYLPLSGGAMNSNCLIIAGACDSSGIEYSGGILLREYKYSANSLEDNWKNGPGISFHWSGLWVHKLNMHSNALYWDNTKISLDGHDHDGRYLRYYRYSSSETPDANSLSDGWHDAYVAITNAPTANHGTLILNSYNGTPFLIFIPDASYYIYKRYNIGSIGGTWTKISAGYADSAGCILSMGDATIVTGRNFHYDGAYTYRIYGQSGYPTYYAAVIGFGHGSHGSAEVAVEWTQNIGIYYRSAGDWQDWSAWKRIYDDTYRPYADYAGYLTDFERLTRVAKDSSNNEIESVTGWRTYGFIQVQRFCPPEMYRTTEDMPAPYGIGFGNGSESGGIMPVGSGDYLKDIIFYGANSGPTIFRFGKQLWEGESYDSRYSNSYATYLSIDSTNGNLSTSGTLTSTGTTTSSGFVKSGSDDNYVLLAGGGHKALSDFKIGDYLPLSGGTVTGNISMNNSASITNLPINGGIYWNPYVESATDGTDAASITLINSGPEGGTTLVLTQQNDANDTIQFVTDGSANLYHNSNKIWDAGNDGSGSGLDADTVDGLHASDLMLRVLADGSIALNGASFAHNAIIGTINGNTYTGNNGKDLDNRSVILHFSGGKYTGHWNLIYINSGSMAFRTEDHQDWWEILHSGNYSSYALPISGGTMNAGAIISWADWGLWGADSPTYPKANGGLLWTGTSDSLNLFAEETDSDDLRLILQCGDDSSPSFDIRRADGTTTIRLHSNGTITGTSIINSGSNDSYVLLGGGGTKLISDFLQRRDIRSDMDDLYNLRYNYGGFDKCDYNGTYASDYPACYGLYISLAYNDKNSAVLLFFDCPGGKQSGPQPIYVRTRGAGDSTLEYSPWGALAYLTDNVASATKLQTARTIWGQSFDGSGDISGNLTFLVGSSGMYGFVPQASGPWRLHLYTEGSPRITVRDDGLVGIGVDNPGNTYKLDVNGSTNSTTLYQNGSAINSLFVSSLGVDGNQLTWTKNGTPNNITVPYATSSNESNYLTCNKQILVSPGAITAWTWYSTGILGTSLDTGIYILRVSISTNGPFWSCNFVGLLYWFSSSTNALEADEVIMHSAGHANNSNVHIYIRTLKRELSTLLMLMTSNVNLSAYTYTFRFFKIGDY